MRTLTKFALPALLALAFAAPAQASIAIDQFETTSSEDGAGTHPDLTTTFKLAEPGVQEAAKDVVFEAPEGVFGNPNAVSECTAADFATNECSPNSQAGLVTVVAKTDSDPEELLGTAPIFVLVPQDKEGETARLSFIVPKLDIPIAIPVSVRTGSDYGLRFTVKEISQLTPLAETKLSFWGYPADPVHDSQRFPKGVPGTPSNCPGIDGTGCLKTGTEASIPVAPLIDYPTTCTGQPLVTELQVRSYQDPGTWSSANSQYPPVDGCEKANFNPVLSANLTTGEADSASGLDLTFNVPQPLGRNPTPSQLKKVTVTLPPGVTINPDAADGQSACTDAQANFGSEGPAECPDNAKIGTVSIYSPALNGALVGSMYIGQPRPGEQYRLFEILSGFGLNAKLVGTFTPDPQTGQLTGTFENLPQVPFEEFNLHLFASDRGLIATPTSCAIYSVEADFVPWNGILSPQTSERFLNVTTGPGGSVCPGPIRPFKPRLVAGMPTALAGAFSAFHLKLDRDDGMQFLQDVNFRMPPGFTGDLSGIPYCPDAAIEAAARKRGLDERQNPSCPAASKVGTSNVAAGPGSHPFHAVGNMYLAGPFRGAPLSVAVLTPALAGPYDYGTVVVRVALHVDPLTAQVSALSDTIPSIIGGVPIRMRSIQVSIDKENFTINPTNCSPFSVDSRGIGDQGTVTDFSSYFHAVNCATLPFRPKFTVRQVGGRRSTNRSSNPALEFDLVTRPGEANIKSLSVTLPNAFEIDQRHLGRLCSEKELAATECAGRQQIGRASTTTPLLDQPLSGPVYAVSGSGGLPRLAFLLNGQVDLLPRAESRSVRGGRLQTTVPVVPDAPIGHFHLLVYGGKQGYLANTRSLCAQVPVVRVGFNGQNGKTRTAKVPVKTPCTAAARRNARGHRR
jgi:hypothetical protein